MANTSITQPSHAHTRTRHTQSHIHGHAHTHNPNLSQPPPKTLRRLNASSRKPSANAQRSGVTPPNGILFFLIRIIRIIRIVRSGQA
ncbi:hypothetical protein T492DRAFT_1053740 [Pavlovales sp. CCMP2436]|nr:hypothetical protein T492DRAFT_1053740 [Pavlovales sp. CCMP2436]